MSDLSTIVSSAGQRQIDSSIEAIMASLGGSQSGGSSLLSFPPVLLVGASTTRMNTYGDVSPQRGGPMAGSPISWYQMLYGRRIKFDNQPNLGVTDPDRTYQRGYDYGADGARATDETSHSPSFTHQIDAAIADWSTTSSKPFMVIVSERNDVDGGFTSSQYITAMTALYTKALAAGFKVIATELWNPMLTDSSSAYTGASAPGRQVTLDFNTWVNANWQSLGITALVPLFAAMTDTGTSGNPPKTGYTADTRHYSPKGGKAGAAAYAAVFNAIAAARTYGAPDANNIFSAFTASGGTANTGVTGTLSGNVQATKSVPGSTATIVAATAQDSTTNEIFQRLTISNTTGVTAPGEIVTLEPITMPTPAAGVTHGYRQRVRIKATNVPYAIYATMQDDGASQARVNAITPITNVSGNTPTASPATGIQWFDGSTDLDLWLDSPGIAWSGAGTAHWKLAVLYAASASNSDTLVVEAYAPITFTKSNLLTPRPLLTNSFNQVRGVSSVIGSFGESGEGFTALGGTAAATIGSDSLAYFTTAGLIASTWVPPSADYDVIATIQWKGDVSAQNVYVNARAQSSTVFISAGRFSGKWQIVINSPTTYFYPSTGDPTQSANANGTATPVPSSGDIWILRLRVQGNSYSLYATINGGTETLVAQILSPDSTAAAAVAAAGSAGIRNSGTLGTSTTGALYKKLATAVFS